LSCTEFLFARPSFWTGLARLLDLRGTLAQHSYRISDSPREADLLATRSDWFMVGDDIAEALISYGEMTEDERAAEEGEAP
jgi:hypothetical protein